MSDDRSRPPRAAVADHVPSEFEYVGLWLRVGASVIDTALILLVSYVSFLAFGLGILWVAVDRRKQGWHDKLARTVVVRPLRSGATPMRFDAA